MTIEPVDESESPFPSASEMDLDLWRVGASVHPDTFYRTIEGVAGENIAYVLGVGKADADRDTRARRFEMIGDLYEELRKLADKARAAGLDTSQAEMVLSDFVSPKPFVQEKE